MHSEPDSSRSLFLDVLFLALLGFVVIAVLLLFHVNPPKRGEDDSKPPGSPDATHDDFMIHLKTELI